MLENMTCVSATLGDSFKMEAMVPLRADSAPIIPPEAPAAFLSEAPPVCHTPETVDMIRRIPTPWHAHADDTNRPQLTIIKPTATATRTQHAPFDTPLSCAAPMALPTIETYLLQASPSLS
jgi:hypothetical protein